MPSLNPLTEGTETLAGVAEAVEALTGLAERTETLSTLAELTSGDTTYTLYPGASTYPGATSYPGDYFLAGVGMALAALIERAETLIALSEA